LLQTKNDIVKTRRIKKKGKFILCAIDRFSLSKKRNKIKTKIQNDIENQNIINDPIAIINHSGKQYDTMVIMLHLLETKKRIYFIQ